MGHFNSYSQRPSSDWSRNIRRRPTLFGVPFVLLIVGASFGLQTFTQTRYDLHSQRVTAVSKQEELGLGRNRKRLNIQEEYYRLGATEDKDWQQKRIPRPLGLPEWGVPPDEQVDNTPSS